MDAPLVMDKLKTTIERLTRMLREFAENFQRSQVEHLGEPILVTTLLIQLLPKEDIFSLKTGLCNFSKVNNTRSDHHFQHNIR